MSNAWVLLHHFEMLANASGVQLDAKSRADIEDIVESLESDIADLRDDVRELREQIGKA